jgi:hypothetical protein
LSPWLDFAVTLLVALALLAVALGVGELLERGGRSDDDYYDEPPERNNHETPPEG